MNVGYVFTSTTSSSKLTLECEEMSTWMELADHFVNFVQGCGFIVSPAEIGEYIVDNYSSVKDTVTITP